MRDRGQESKTGLVGRSVKSGQQRSRSCPLVAQGYPTSVDQPQNLQYVCLGCWFVTSVELGCNWSRGNGFGSVERSGLECLGDGRAKVEVF